MHVCPLAIQISAWYFFGYSTRYRLLLSFLCAKPSCNFSDVSKEKPVLRPFLLLGRHFSADSTLEGPSRSECLDYMLRAFSIAWLLLINHYPVKMAALASNGPALFQSSLYRFQPIARKILFPLNGVYFPPSANFQTYNSFAIWVMPDS